MKKAGQVLTLFSVLSVLKLPWFVLQVVVWGSMYSQFQEQTGSWSQAVQMTLDKDNRCQFCKTLQSVEPADNNAPVLLTERESPLLLPCFSIVSANRQPLTLPAQALVLKSAHRPHAPPLPPPRPSAYS